MSLPESAPPPGTVPGKPVPRKNKGPKPGSKEDPKRDERLIRSKLEKGLEKLAKFEDVSFIVFLFFSLSLCPRAERFPDNSFAIV